ncbi:ABC transporter ATP-binding protein [Fervidobacterium thailandense]|uniref:High-affinity branched-chain amino acid ABC transporter ATP-binding protein LivG n=1 Tax=Fervidobacterium thailandense TaxID=1008305 RepID=A0A1E3G740_9BACT|nr:ABC transporter ATP-binding protein [Fervidobacterium thailandense]ODN31428.1 high-affinity branched-chain amino acid ABC transporter ATP-binding protein LivG [Fervidobacterium thailandense]
MTKETSLQDKKAPTQQKNVILRMTNVTKKFGGIVAVSNFNLELKEGELLGLIGPNGAGKTTVFNLITHVFPVTEGRIEFLGRDITKLSTDKIIRLGVARTFQNIRLFGSMTVEENILTGFHAHLKSNLFSSVAFLPSYQREEEYFRAKAEELMKDLGIEHLRDFKATALPYGLQRKLEIARALATSPKLLLLDEPAAGMNPDETLELNELILKIREKYGLTIIVIEHDMKVIMNICERIIVLDHGVTIAEGTPKEIQTNPEVIKAYLGAGDEDA